MTKQVELPTLDVFKKDLEILNYALDLMGKNEVYELTGEDIKKINKNFGEKMKKISSESEDRMGEIITLGISAQEETVDAMKESFKFINARLKRIQAIIAQLLLDVDQKSDTYKIDDFLKELYKK